MFVDLHIHSYFSDGAQTPEQAALACRDSGVGLAALCDHNSWLGCERFAAACEDLGVQSIRGAEFDCRWQGYHLHILGYGFTPTPQLAAIAHRRRGRCGQFRLHRNAPALCRAEGQRKQPEAQDPRAQQCQISPFHSGPLPARSRLLQCMRQTACKCPVVKSRFCALERAAGQNPLLHCGAALLYNE